MIILFGLRRKASRLGAAFLMCNVCHTPAAHVITRVRRYFTVFFIPIIPLGTKHVITCTMCSQATPITLEAAVGYLHQSAPASPAPSALAAVADAAGAPGAPPRSAGTPSR